jgi:hypothetical protein
MHEPQVETRRSFCRVYRCAGSWSRRWGTRLRQIIDRYGRSAVGITGMAHCSGFQVTVQPVDA